MKQKLHDIVYILAERLSVRHLILQYSLGIRCLLVIIAVGVSVTLLFCVALERMHVSSLTFSPSTLQLYHMDYIGYV